MVKKVFRACLIPQRGEKKDLIHTKSTKKAIQMKRGRMMWRKEYPIKNFLMITNEESDDRDTQGGEGGKSRCDT